MILGATGTGKTTFEAAASGFLQRFDPLMFVVDFNRSTELFVRAYGGSYFTLQEGIYTGCNPWQLAEGPESPVWHRLLAFLKRWTQVLARDNQGNPCSDEHGIELNAAVESIMRMPVEERRTALLLDIVSPELQTRLAKWCDNGEYAWAVDSPGIPSIHCIIKKWDLIQPLSWTQKTVFILPVNLYSRSCFSTKKSCNAAAI